MNLPPGSRFLDELACVRIWWSCAACFKMCFWTHPELTAALAPLRNDSPGDGSTTRSIAAPRCKTHYIIVHESRCGVVVVVVVRDANVSSKLLLRLAEFCAASGRTTNSRKHLH